MKNIIGHGVTYVILYMLFMIPTYILPFFGSNSSLAHASIGLGNPGFWLHLLSLAVLVGLCWVRGEIVNKQWLIIFPILAAIFDLVPGLNFIMLIPTLLHLAAIIVGVIASSTVQVSAPASGSTT